MTELLAYFKSMQVTHLPYGVWERGVKDDICKQNGK
jgi:hypothetical protein